MAKAKTADKEYGAKFLGALDFVVDGQLKSPTMEVTGFIPANQHRAANGKLVDKPIIVFTGKGGDKLLALPKVGWQVLHLLTGVGPLEGEKWLGTKVRLQVRIVWSFGQLYAAVRILPPDGTFVTGSISKRLGVKALYDVEHGGFWCEQEPKK